MGKLHFKGKVKLNIIHVDAICGKIYSLNMDINRCMLIYFKHVSETWFHPRKWHVFIDIYSVDC